MTVRRDYGQAEKFFLESIKLNSANVQGYLALATLYNIKEFGKEAEAEKILQQGMTANPKDSIFPATLASLFSQRGDWQMARQYLREALVLDPRNQAIEDELVRLERKLGR